MYSLLEIPFLTPTDVAKVTKYGLVYTQTFPKEFFETITNELWVKYTLPDVEELSRRGVLLLDDSHYESGISSIILCSGPLNTVFVYVPHNPGIYGVEVALFHGLNGASERYSLKHPDMEGVFPLALITWLNLLIFPARNIYNSPFLLENTFLADKELDETYKWLREITSEQKGQIMERTVHRTKYFSEVYALDEMITSSRELIAIEKEQRKNLRKLESTKRLDLIFETKDPQTFLQKFILELNTDSTIFEDSFTEEKVPTVLDALETYLSALMTHKTFQNNLASLSSGKSVIHEIFRLTTTVYEETRKKLDDVISDNSILIAAKNKINSHIESSFLTRMYTLFSERTNPCHHYTLINVENHTDITPFPPALKTYANVYKEGLGVGRREALEITQMKEQDHLLDYSLYTLDQLNDRHKRYLRNYRIWKEELTDAIKRAIGDSLLTWEDYFTLSLKLLPEVFYVRALPSEPSTEEISIFGGLKTVQQLLDSFASLDLSEKERKLLLRDLCKSLWNPIFTSMTDFWDLTPDIVMEINDVAQLAISVSSPYNQFTGIPITFITDATWHDKVHYNSWKTSLETMRPTNWEHPVVEKFPLYIAPTYELSLGVDAKHDILKPLLTLFQKHIWTP